MLPFTPCAFSCRRHSGGTASGLRTVLQMGIGCSGQRHCRGCGACVSGGMGTLFPMSAPAFGSRIFGVQHQCKACRHAENRLPKRCAFGAACCADYGQQACRCRHSSSFFHFIPSFRFPTSKFVYKNAETDAPAGNLSLLPISFGLQGYYTEIKVPKTGLIMLCADFGLLDGFVFCSFFASGIPKRRKK